MRYKDSGELHMDFHGATNTTINYIVDKFGENGLKEIFTKVGKDVYKSIHEGLKKDDPSELIEHLKYYLDRENGEYSFKEDENKFVLEVKKCPAIAQLIKLGLKPSGNFCNQTIDVNNAMCDGTPWECKTEVLDLGVCRQIFVRRESMSR